VTTATAIGLIVDVARVPLYLLFSGREVLAVWPLAATASVGVLVGTLAGRRVLERFPEMLFRRVVSSLSLALGISMLLSLGR
jgi:uncharacterized membrane protein YfcA